MRDAQPVKSRADYPPGEGPKSYGASENSELMRLSGQLFFDHHDLCRFHFAVVGVTKERLNDLEAYVNDHRQIIDAAVDFDSYDAIVQSRLREHATSWEIEIDSVQGYGDQLFVVGLWALAEQYCTRALEIAERACGSKRKIPYHWAGIEKRIREFGVDITRCERFSDANECRIVNNKVKHLGVVDSELATYSAFQSVKNRPLNGVEIDLQRYSNAIVEFIEWVIEQIDNQLVTRVAGR